MGKEKKRQLGIPSLVVLLVIVLASGVLFMGAVSGWFNGGKIILDEEYYCGEDCSGEFMDITVEEYEKLIEAKKSFIVFIDQSGCTTADRLRGYISDLSLEMKVQAYRMMFQEVKESSLHDFVKYYPSVAIIAKGKVVSFLRADSDEDAEAYNNYEEFKAWMKKSL